MADRPHGSRGGQRVAAWCPLCGTQGWTPSPTGDPYCDNAYCDVRTFRYSSYTKSRPEERVQFIKAEVSR